MPEDKLPLDLTDYSGSVRSSIYSQNSGTLSMNDLAGSLFELNPQATNYWIDRVSIIDRSSIEQTFDRLPDAWGSEVHKTFAIDLLNASRERLVDISRLSSAGLRSTIHENPTIKVKTQMLENDRSPAPASSPSPN